MSDASLWETISEGEKWMLSVMLLGALWGSSPRPSDFIMAKIFLHPQYGQWGLNKKTEPWTKDYHSIKWKYVVWNLIHLARNRIFKNTLLIQQLKVSALSRITACTKWTYQAKYVYYEPSMTWQGKIPCKDPRGLSNFCEGILHGKTPQASIYIF